MRPPLGLVAGLLLLAVAAAGAEEPPAPPREGARPEPPAVETPSLRVPPDDEVAKLLEELKAASKKKKASDVLPTLEKFDGLTHPDFLKPLMKLLSHGSTEVAVRAARLLDAQSTVDVDEKVQAKNGRDLWKAGWAHPDNEKRAVVRGEVLRALGTWEYELDDEQVREVEKFWRAQVGNPIPERADALVGVAAYFEKTKDKRLCRQLAEEIDQPMATSPNDPNNPPASWWEARWKLWDKVHLHAVRALKSITGQEFKSTEQAKTWFQENEKTFGYRW